MNPDYLNLLRCPKTGKKLEFAKTLKVNGKIKEGILTEPVSGNKYPIINFIPRFVDDENYVTNFGLEWNVYDKTQYDMYSGYLISEERFKKETRWECAMDELMILEAGSGSGRFTTHAVDTGAMVVSFDLSKAVEANYSSNGNRDNLTILQADIYKLPLKKESFDKIFCFGVLQHTPNPKDAFFSLLNCLKPGGIIVSDIYAKTFVKLFLSTKYYIRPLTKKMSPEKLHSIIKTYVNFMWPLSKIIRKIPRIGYSINWRLMVADYSNILPGAKDYILKEWAYLDTFDMLSPRYDFPQTLNTFKKWHYEAGLTEIDVHYRYNGIEGRAKKAS